MTVGRASIKPGSARFAGRKSPAVGTESATGSVDLRRAPQSLRQQFDVAKKWGAMAKITDANRVRWSVYRRWGYRYWNAMEGSERDSLAGGVILNLLQSR
jgi:poly(3-hydroxybutyrate) depolymerase